MNATHCFTFSTQLIYSLSLNPFRPISWSPLNSDSVQMEPNGPVRVHFVPSVHCQELDTVRNLGVIMDAGLKFDKQIQVSKIK